MYNGRLVYAQIMDFLPLRRFKSCVERYNGNHRVKSFSCLDQFHSMSFAQLTGRESLRDIEVCLNASADKLYHMGMRSRRVARSTLAVANEKRDWRIFADLAQILIARATELYRGEPIAEGLEELDAAAYALDSTTISLCMSLFPWARFRSAKSGVKLHALLDLRGSIPQFIHITDAKAADVRVLDELIILPGAYYIMDRAYLDFERLWRLEQAKAFFVTRTQKDQVFARRYSLPGPRGEGVFCDQSIILTGDSSKKKYPVPLRRVGFHDAERDKRLHFLSNNFALDATKIASLYKARWQIELFFKWIKQHLRIKQFYGTSENAVKTQIWISVSVYLLLAIARKELCLPESLNTIRQVLSLNLFEQVSLNQLFANPSHISPRYPTGEQLILFDF